MVLIVSVNDHFKVKHFMWVVQSVLTTKQMYVSDWQPISQTLCTWFHPEVLEQRSWMLVMTKNIITLGKKDCHKSNFKPSQMKSTYHSYWMFDCSFPHIIEGRFQDHSRGRGAYQKCKLNINWSGCNGKLKNSWLHVFKKLPSSHNAFATPPATLKSNHK